MTCFVLGGMINLISVNNSGKEPLEISDTGFYWPDALPVTQSTVSEHRIEHNAPVIEWFAIIISSFTA